MKKTTVSVMLGVLSVAGLATVAYVYRNQARTPAPVVAQGSVPDVQHLEKGKVLGAGVFKDADAVHRGSGTVSIVSSGEGAYLRLGADFKVTPGPDLFVYASPDVSSEGLGDYEVIGKLRSFNGEQVYNLPAQYENYRSIVIWCRSFGVTFSTADLR